MDESRIGFRRPKYMLTGNDFEFHKMTNMVINDKMFGENNFKKKFVITK